MRKKSNLLIVFFIFLVLNSKMSATISWNGQFDASYNSCDGTFSFTFFFFKNNTGAGHDDLVGNFVLEYKDNTGAYRKLFIFRNIKGMGCCSNAIPSWNASDNWRKNDGTICTDATKPSDNDTRFVNGYTNSTGVPHRAFTWSTSATVAATGANQVIYPNNYENGEPIFLVSTYQVSDKSFVTFKWRNPPAYLRTMNTVEFKMPFATTIDHNGDLHDATGFGHTVPAFTRSVSIDPVKVPSGLTATKNRSCNSVNIEWSVIEDYCKSAHYRLYRDGSLLINQPIYVRPNNTTANSFISSYIDENPIKGVNHNYQLELVHFIDDCGPAQGSTTASCWANFTGQRSSGSVGRVKSAPPAPYGLTATDNKCNKTIELAWNVNQSIADATPHTAFRLERSTNSDFSAGFTIFDDLVEGARSFVDTNIQENVKYFYRLRAKNGCSNNGYDISSASNTAQGISPGSPPKVTSVSVTKLSNNNVQVNWTNPSPFISNFVVTRSLLTGGGTTNLSTLEKTFTQFTDSLAQICVDYVYRIKSTNVCNTSGVESDAFDTIRLDPVLNNTFETSTGNILVGSKGYYPNRVELNWNNNNAASITGWKIYRKNIAAGGDSTLIASPSATSGQYIDYTADANVFYKYTIVGEANCGTSILKTNISEDIGFRYPSGTVSGNITYEGGVVVKDVKVIAQPSSGNSGYAMNFTGTNSGAQIEAASNLNSTNPYTIEFWMRPTDLSADAVLLRKTDGTNTHYSIIYNQATNKIDFSYKTGATTHTVSSNFNLATGTYTHVTAVKETNKLKLYKNGVLLDSIVTTAGLNAPNAPIDLGYNSTSGTQRYNGSIDELRIYKRAKTSREIIRDFNRYINPEDNDLVAYFPFDENVTVIRNAYDLSKSNGQFNRNKVNFQSGNNYSATIPNTSELNNIGYTDTNGFYVINACRYTGTGQNFTMTPIFGTHSFTPSNKIEFVGEGSTVKSNVDFKDNSSFTFDGRVMYKNTNCAVEGAVVYIDDAAVIKAGEIIKSGADGKFQIRVPIGEHFVSVKYPNHDFSVGRFPLAEGTLYNFQANVAGEYQFIDSTLRKVVGRVVGGQVEASKALNLGRSINNIGKAQLIFRTVNGCKKDTVWTVDSSGEYTSYLLPVKYEVENIKIPSNLGLNFVNSEGIGKQLDLSLKYESKTYFDTVYKYIDSAGKTIRQFLRVDSASYHGDYSYTHRNVPTVVMKGSYETNPATKDSLFIGESSLLVDTTSISTLPYIPGSSANKIKYPVFKYYNNYTAKFEITENYTNNDGAVPKTTKYPVSGILNISSYIGTNSGSFPVDQSGKFIWSFMGGLPNLLVNNTVPDYSFTSPLQITFNSPGNSAVEYKPFPVSASQNLDGLYRAYVLGAKTLGTNFVTKDVDRVDFVLRDPPGTNSFSSWTSGSKINVTSFTGEDKTEAGSVAASVSLGGKSETEVGGGFGAIVLIKSIELERHISVDHTSSWSFNDVSSNSITTETENLSTISTSSSPDEVGHMADVFIGNGKNVIFGGAIQLCLIDTNQCNSPNYECYGDLIKGKYKIGKYNSISIADGIANTRFHYTTREIEEIVIPNIELLRNNLFITDSNVYKLVFKDKTNKVKYASNNDDRNAWGFAVPISNKSRETTDADTIGNSYIFYKSRQSKGDSILTVKDTVVNGQIVKLKRYIKANSVDKVRQYNIQILQWKKELAKNEKEKYIALVTNSSSANVDNLSVGTATIQKTYNSSSEEAHTTETNKEYSNETALGIQNGFAAFGIGVQIELKGTYSYNKITKSGNGTTNSKSTSFEYVFQDENQGDLLNLAVKNPTDGGGHIFKVLAGQTSCPYQAAEYLKWYNPTANDNTDNFPYLYASSESGNSIEFSPRTVQIDVPSISVAQPSKINIPSDEAAVFNMVLGNLSEANKTRDYTLKVDLVSNPFGAIVKVDGLDPNRTFTIPAGVGINKTLTIEKGPTKFEYDSIMLIFHAACDVDKENIADTVYVSAHFVPTCNKATLQNPGDLWTSNNITGDTIPILIKDYNYNLEGFSNIQLKYKKTNTSMWSTQEVFYKDTAGMNNPQAKLIPTSQSYITYQWPIKDLADGPYEVKLDVRCDFQDFPNIIREMPKQIGIIDKINPVPFGTPSPSDGILDPNDDISIQFNEPLDNGTMGFHNFDIRGVLNETPIRNATSLFFNGTTNYMEVLGDVNLQQRSFTIETWVKKAENGRMQSLFTQGSDVNQSFDLGFGADDKIYFRVNNETIKSDTAYTNLSNWHHFALTYDHIAEQVQMYWDGGYVNGGSVRNMYTDNLANGKMNIARNLSGQNQYFKGNLSEIRVWNIHRSLADIASTMNKTVNRSNSGTLYNWRLDEAEGTEAKDAIRERNATVHGATWQVDPSSSSVSLNGTNQYIEVEAGNYGISKEMDMTLEFWFNSSQSGAATLVSNGKGFQHADSLTAWNIHKDGNGKIHVKNNNFDWVATDSNYFDGQWHHFALVLNRKANTTVYVDGNQQKTTPSSNFEQFGGANIYLGALGYYNTSSIFQVENFLQGNLDEFRFWNTARLVEQVKRDKRNRLKGDEGGLLSYVPFEEYFERNGVPLLIQSMKDVADTSHSVTLKNNATFSSLSPTLKLPRAVQSILFDYVLNNDKIVLTPNVQAKYIENITLDITTKGVQDKNGNIQQSPKTWIAYIDKNQIVWGDAGFSFDKKLNEELTFTSSVVNKGGATKEFTINNIPTWLTVTPSSGVIAPNSVLSVTLKIDPGLAIGSYEHDVQLLTDFGFAEKLNIQVKCRKDPPKWEVDPAKYQYSMNVIGKLKINNVISSDIEDRLAVFVGDECRGVASVKYVSQYDDYFVFLDIYSNDPLGQEVFKNRIWDASVGSILTEVTPKINFESNGLMGTVSNPVIFNANNNFAHSIPLTKGWNWVSINVISSDSADINKMLSKLKSTKYDVFKGQVNHNVFDQKWNGSLNYIVPNNGYMLKSNIIDTLEVSGVLANPTERLIMLDSGWSWIGFNSIRNLSINTAFGNLNPSDEDLIKGKNNFAVYDNRIGWIGSLATLRPGEGYMYKTKVKKSFYYPIAGFYKSGSNDSMTVNTYFPVQSNEFESNTNVVATLNCTNITDFSPLTIAAFDESKVCRGAIKFSKDKIGESQLAFLTVSGNLSNQLSLKVYNEKTDRVIDLESKIKYQSNEVLGSIKSPYLITESAQKCIEIMNGTTATPTLTNDAWAYPVQFKDEVKVTVRNVTKESVRVEMYDIVGKSLAQFTKDYQSLHSEIELQKEFNGLANLPSGIYILRVTIGDYSNEIKLVK